MDPNTTIRLLQVVAWPAIAVLGIVILGPGRLLERLIDRLTDNAGKIAATIREFRESTEKLAGEIALFQESARALSVEVTPSLTLINERLVTLAANVREIERSTSDTAVNLGSRTVDDRLGDVVLQTPDNQADLTIEMMFNSIVERWSVLSERLRERIGAATFDGRTMGAMAWRLVDGRRAHPLAAEDAQLITDLHSQFKRFTRLQSTKEDWMSFEVYESFVRGVQRALQALEE